MAIWGSSFVVTTLVLDEAGPFAVTFLRFGLAVSTDEEAQELRFPGTPRSGLTAATGSARPSARTGDWTAESTPLPKASRVRRRPIC
jgi:hypothetical protein